MADSVARPWHVALALGLGTMVSHGFGLSLVPAMLPRIEDTFQSGYGVLGLAIATGLIAYALGASIASRVLDWLPTRTVLIGSFLLTATGLLTVATSSSPTVIALSVVLLGLSAPISWTATIHVAGETVAPTSLAVVTATASGGSGAGVIINGVLVQASAELNSWRLWFVFAALMAGVAIAASIVVFRRPISRPSASGGTPTPGAYRMVMSSRPGRVVVITSAVTGVAGFTFLAFLTATAIDEMGVSAVAAAALFWIAGIVGTVAAPFFGRLGDRATPLFAIAAVVATYAVSLDLLAAFWIYPSLVIGAIGLGVLNYPVWGLMAALANRSFQADIAVRAVSLGLVAAAVLGALGNALTGIWIDAYGSMRAPVIMLGLAMSATAVWLAALHRRERRASRDATIPVHRNG